jgi:hypothetical protein
MGTYVVSVPAGSQSRPQVLGGTALLESASNLQGPWTTVLSATAAASFRPLVNGYVRLTATTQAGSMAVSEMAGVNSPGTTSVLVSSNIPFASPSSTAAQQIFAFKIPDKFLSTNFKLSIEFGLNLTNNANVKTVNVLMNGAGGTNVMTAAVTSFATFNGYTTVFAFDGAVLAGGMGGSTVALATLARDYINNETEFVISITKATGTDTAEVISCVVRLSQ